MSESATFRRQDRDLTIRYRQSMASDSVSPRTVRIGDRERDAVVSVLQQAHADGRLDMAELDDRLDAAMRARTYADLEPLVVDLSENPIMPKPTPVRSSLLPSSPGYSGEDPLRLDGGEKREGSWIVPPFIRIEHDSRWVRLDFQQATPASDVIDIDVIEGAGWILLILPDGWAADVDRLSLGLGTTSVKAPRDPDPGLPLLVIHGSLGSGRLRLRTPNRGDRRRLAKRTNRQSR